MKLTILRLTALTAQDRIDLAKIWPEEDLAKLEQSLDDDHQLYAARFNERLLAALKLERNATTGVISQLMVREVTRRRGVGRYLLEETLAQNSTLVAWRIADRPSAEGRAFVAACGFQLQGTMWVK